MRDYRYALPLGTLAGHVHARPASASSQEGTSADERVHVVLDHDGENRRADGGGAGAGDGTGGSVEVGLVVGDDADRAVRGDEGGTRRIEQGLGLASIGGVIDIGSDEREHAVQRDDHGDGPAHGRIASARRADAHDDGIVHRVCPDDNVTQLGGDLGALPHLCEHVAVEHEDVDLGSHGDLTGP